MIAAVDQFVLYDEVQYTKNDWRNRNTIKTPQGLQWLTVPTGQSIDRTIREVILPDPHWQTKHWKTLSANYAKSLFYKDIGPEIESLYRSTEYSHLSELNETFISYICHYLHISTKILQSTLFPKRSESEKSARLLDICLQLNASEYVSGPAAKSYLDVRTFHENGIKVTWFDYAGYPEYPQMWGGGFKHEVSILDLILNCGPNSKNFMKYV